MEEAVVHPLEIEEADERFAHARIGELLTPRVEDERGHAGGQPDRDLVLDDAAVGDGGKRIALRPQRRIVLAANVDLASLEGLELCRGVAEILEADLVEVEAAAVHGQIAAPVVGVALVGDGAAGIDLADAVRA